MSGSEKNGETLVPRVKTSGTKGIRTVGDVIVLLSDTLADRIDDRIDDKLTNAIIKGSNGINSAMSLIGRYGRPDPVRGRDLDVPSAAISGQRLPGALAEPEPLTEDARDAEIAELRSRLAQLESAPRRAPERRQAASSAR